MTLISNMMLVIEKRKYFSFFALSSTLFDHKKNMWLYSRCGEDPRCQGPNADPEVLGAGVHQQHFSAAAAGASSTSCTHAGGWEASS